MHRLLRIALLTITAALLAAAQADAQEISVRPALLVTDGDPLPALRFRLSTDRSDLFVGTTLPREWTWSAALDAPLAWHAGRNPETLRAAFQGGLQLSLFRAATPPGEIPSPDDPPPVSYGYLAFDVGLAAESPQTFDHGDVAIGAIINYEHDQYHRLWFVPEARIAFDGVICIDCDPAGEDADATHTRLDGELGWNLPLDRRWTPAPLRPLWLRLRGRGFNTWGLDSSLETIRNADGIWGSVEVAYRLDRGRWLHEIFVNWRDGELPQRLREERAWSGGVTLSF